MGRHYAYLILILLAFATPAMAATPMVSATTFNAYSSSVKTRLDTKSPVMHSGYSIGTCTTTAAIDPANGEDQYLTLGGNCTATIALAASGKSTKLFLRVIQGASPYTMALKYTGGTKVKWSGATEPVITTTNGAIDMIPCRVYSTYAACSASQDMR